MRIIWFICIISTLCALIVSILPMPYKLIAALVNICLLVIIIVIWRKAIYHKRNKKDNT